MVKSWELSADLINASQHQDPDEATDAQAPVGGGAAADPHRQKGFISGRSPHHHLRFPCDLQHQLTVEQRDGIAVFLDFTKAYDRVSWGYILDVLRRMGFDPRFCAWIRILYYDSQALLDVNNKLITAVRPTRGVKQGNPLSVFLFLFCIEPLGNMLCARPELGIHLSGGLHATGLFFADPLTLLAATPAAAEMQLRLVNLYCAGSGAMLNRSKSSVLALNKISHRQCLSGCAVSYLITTSSFLVSRSASKTQLHTQLLVLIDACSIGCAYGETVRKPFAADCSLPSLWSSRLFGTSHRTSYVPQKMVQRWQRLLENFVLSRRIDPEDRPVRLISRDPSHKAPNRGGLGIPQIAAFLRRLRILLLQ